MIHAFLSTLFVIVTSTFLFFFPMRTEGPTRTETEEKPATVQKINTTTPVLVKQTSTTTPVKKVVKKPIPEVTSTTTIVVQTPVVQKPTPDFVKINETSRKSVVNILCTTKGGELSPITGTGVIIDARGIILTNAHIGQYFLVQDFREKNYVHCIVRTGSPAYPRYNVELMYISPRWVESNKDLLKQSNPQGTGEHDFALLRITNSINKEPLPTFNYIAPNTQEITAEGDPVLLASYPAGFLGGLSVLQDLNITTAITTIKKIYTYKQNTVDLISVPGTVVSQKGASGGAVVDGDNKLIGIITTSSDGKETSDRDLRAITLSHINRSLLEETTGNLSDLLSQNPDEVSRIFNTTIAPTLSKIIIDELKK